MKQLAIIQGDTLVGLPDYNYPAMEEAIRAAAEKSPHIIVLPETWNTGFKPDKDLPKLCDINGERTKEMLSRLAKELNVHIVGGSVSTLKDDKVYNTTYIADKNGTIVSEYDKVHGFSLAKEDVYYAGGTKIHKFQLDDLICSSITCYDLRFPEFVRTVALQNIDILFIPAQWPISRVAHWRILNQARAIENQIYVCAVNGCGHIGRAKMAGHSLVVDPFGNIQLELGETPQIGVTFIDRNIIADIRERINVYNDRKPELYSV